ncbi:3-hydroxybutyryl-CoA dehydrogenase [uncultured Cohaesibacter sp.]|uniref:3-hydroxybutyryl-CoA dehydrogenase n=1 Tax=uncultured Cohaesibacter sp. TaxID=1002546 RepID=UPI00292F5B0B|nr:3-hydroxybutyryl-CoA dehydrogenase [uncultured Cohaesibacter sp.]
MSEIRKIGIIGAGQMGNGIAHVCSLAKYEVVLNDIDNEKLEKSIKTVDQILSRQVEKGRISQKVKDEAFARVQFSRDLDPLSEVDLVIEAVTEEEDAKRKVFTTITPLLRPETIVASNTSSISITRLAAATDRPEHFIGMHFMKPVRAMKLIELVRGIATDEQTFLKAKDFAESLGKTVAVSEDFPAFMVNRILMPMINEAIYTLYEGVGNVESIDTAIRLGANHPMGPLELADFIGLDICLAIMQVLYDGLADTKYRPCPLLVKYVEAGWLGRKSARGFYDYRGEIPIPTR